MRFMKYALLTGCFLLAGAVSAFSQENPFRRDISGIVSKQDFEKIAAFVLTAGDRKTYCQMYNNNPHYQIEDFHVYLNPVSQRINWDSDNLSFSVGDYNVILIQDWNSPHIYYDIRLLKKKVYIDNVYKFDPEYYEDKLIRKYIPKLKLLAGGEKQSRER
jgi:hypothetical protein